MHPALGNITRLMTRSMLTDIQSSPTWNSAIRISSRALSEIEFWKQISKLQPTLMRVNTIYHKVVYSDASNTAGAGYIVGVDKAVTHGMWSLVEQTKK